MSKNPEVDIDICQDPKTSKYFFIATIPNIGQLLSDAFDTEEDAFKAVTNFITFCKLEVTSWEKSNKEIQKTWDQTEEDSW